jgi:hypothetical protein
MVPTLTVHGGSLHFCNSIGTYFWCRNLCEADDPHISSCDACQHYKEPGQGQREVPPRNETAIQGSNIAINLISPWKVNTGGRDIIIKALTVINICTTRRDVVQVGDSTRKQVTIHFENCWPQDTRDLFK